MVNEDHAPGHGVRCELGVRLLQRAGDLATNERHQVYADPAGHPVLHRLGALIVTRFVIDAPTLLHLVDSDLSIDPDHQLVAPNWIRSEALQLLLGDVRQGKRTEKGALETHKRLTGLKMRLLGDRVSRATAWDIAVHHGWDTLRDAEYLAIVRLQADALVTIDPDLAAKAGDAVPVFPLQALLAAD